MRRTIGSCADGKGPLHAEGHPAIGMSSRTDRQRRTLRAGLMSLLVHPTAPPLWLGVAVAAGCIAAETLLVFALRRVAPENTFGALFLLGVLVVSAGWGFGLAVMTTMASALAYIYFHLAPEGGFMPVAPQDAIAIVIFLPVALLANALAGQARLRAAEADQRRREAEVLADQQAALRRVATLVARAVSPDEVFRAVADELARGVNVHSSALVRFDTDGTVVVADSGDVPEALHRLAAAVLGSGTAGRLDADSGLPYSVGVPIVVTGRLWGAALVFASKAGSLPRGVDVWVSDFAGLVATAIANAEARAELKASRVRIVTAGDVARRRFERDLHDGAQQRLVSLGLDLRLAELEVPPGTDGLKERISGVVSGLAAVSEDLREISRGIHPAVLSKGGLGAALKVLARRSRVPVALELHADGRFPQNVEVGVYYVVAESLTNAAKYALASQVEVRLEVDGPNLCLSITDDGVGGADPARGSGLIGLRDRVDTLGGTMEISSPAGNGTALRATIPVGPA
jgi:signal transduction histidine kinase